MSQKIFRILTIIVISITALSVLIGGTYLYENFIYTNPLNKTVQNMQNVESFAIEQTKDRLIIEVQFKQQEKLRPSFYQLLSELEQQKKIDPANLVIKIKNPPNQEVASFLQAGRLPIYEALSTGEFTQLPDKLTALAEKEKVTFELDIDQQYVFLTAYKEGKVGYQVIKRTETPLSVFSMMGGEYI